jgi:parallel beta-helix repeat protein
LLAAGFASGAAAVPRAASNALTASPPIVARSGQVIRDVRISNPAGACITVHDVTDVHIENVELGPCNGPGVSVRGGGGHRIVNSVIHVERAEDWKPGVLVFGAADVLVQGNLLRMNTSSVFALDARNVRVIGNYSENPLGPSPRGQHVQFVRSSGGVIADNYGRLVDGPQGQEDGINLFMTSHVTVARNYIAGGRSRSGCGIVVGDFGGSNNLVEDNTLVRTAQCGIGVAGGSENVVRGNRVLDTYLPEGLGNVGIYVWRVAGADPCQRNVVGENTVSNLWPNGWYGDLWFGDNCTGTARTSNTLAVEARSALTDDALRPPPIPPQPYAGESKTAAWRSAGFLATTSRERPDRG